MTRYALIDVPNIGYASYHVLGSLSLNGEPTGTLFGLMRTCQQLVNTLFATPVFCFDTPPTYRRTLYPGYKSARKKSRENDTEEDKEARQAMYDQINAFQHTWLPAMGATNILAAEGFEADDIACQAVAALPDAKKIYIVSTDQDLWQLLRGTQVVVYNNITKSYFSEADFLKKFDGLQPCMFASLKAWTGCTSDSIEGVAKVGPKTATKWLLGKIPGNPLFEDNISVYSRNIELTRLPAKGCPEVTVLPQGELDWGILERAIGATSRQNPIPAGVKKR
jgi:DNA polymerase-1